MCTDTHRHFSEEEREPFHQQQCHGHAREVGNTVYHRAATQRVGEEPGFGPGLRRYGSRAHTGPTVSCNAHNSPLREVLFYLHL